MSRREDPNGQLDKVMVNQALNYWRMLERVSVLMNEWSNEGMIIEAINIQGPEIRQGGWLAIIKAKDEGQNRFVAFRSGGSVAECLEKISRDAEQGTLMFKEEKPWEPGKGK